MLGSSIRALVGRVTIQKRALEAPNGLACAPKGVRAHLDRACIRRACFIVWFLLLPSYGGCDVVVYDMYN